MKKFNIDTWEIIQDITDKLNENWLIDHAYNYYEDTGKKIITVNFVNTDYYNDNDKYINLLKPDILKFCSNVRFIFDKKIPINSEFFGYDLILIINI